jgi:hypothetical protein
MHIHSICHVYATYVWHIILKANFGFLYISGFNIISSGILYTWYMAVQGSMYRYIPVCTLLVTWRYEKRQNGTYQYVLT